MHLVVIRERLVQEYPWIASNIAFAFNESKRLAYDRVRNPRVVPLAWFSSAWEEQNSFFGHDPWEYGLGPRNGNNLRTLIRYSHEQGLLREQMSEMDAVMSISDEALKGTSGF
jgi:4,5-dihydroxyphthalate decarboxylase